MGPREWERLCEAVLGNPFEAGPERMEARVAVRAATARAGATLEELARQGEHKVARRLAMAMVLEELADHGTSRLLDAKQVPERLFQDLRLSRTAVREATAAAARTTAAIARLAGESAAIRQARAVTWRACHGDSLYDTMALRPLIREQNVLVLGETGTGKELVAQAIAAADGERARTQVVNAAAIPAQLLESELFGHLKGAFTGSVADREGRIAAADGATLFLDEVGDLPATVQAKLLRVVEEDVVTPVGANQGRKVDVRYVAATSQPLAAMVQRGDFRRDLYERLAGITVTMPPLRQRLEDLRPIAESLFERQAGGDGGGGGSSTANLSRLVVHKARFLDWLDSAEARARPWSGNVRELQTVMRRWLLGFRETAAPSAPAAAPAGGEEQPGRASPALARVLEGAATLREVEDWYILHVLEQAQHHQRRAAEILGVDRGTLARRLRQIDDERGGGD